MGWGGSKVCIHVHLLLLLFLKIYKSIKYEIQIKIYIFCFYSDAEAQAPVNVTKSRTFAEVTQGQEKDSKVSEERKTSSLFEGSEEERGNKASQQATKKVNIVNLL